MQKCQLTNFALHCSSLHRSKVGVGVDVGIAKNCAIQSDNKHTTNNNFIVFDTIPKNIF